MNCKRTIAWTYHGLGSWTKAEHHRRAVLESSRQRLGRESAEAFMAQAELSDILHTKARRMRHYSWPSKLRRDYPRAGPRQPSHHRRPQKPRPSPCKRRSDRRRHQHGGRDAARERGQARPRRHTHTSNQRQSRRSLPSHRPHRRRNQDARGDGEAQHGQVRRRLPRHARLPQ